VTFLGIDLGTTSCKVSIIDDEGALEQSASHEYRVVAPERGWAEQDPQLWWDALVGCCDEIEERHPGALGRVEGVSLCGQMHTQVLLDAAGSPLRPAITWMDQRSTTLVDEITADSDADSLIVREAQNKLTTTYTAAHLLWVQRAEPELWNHVATVLVAKDYLKYLLTGTKRIDYAEASGTLLFNNVAEAWSPDLLRLLGVPRRMLPEPGESTEVIGTILPKVGAVLHLTPGIPVVNGSSDNSAAAFGAGMVSAGEAALIIGTAGVVSVCSDQARPDPQFRTLSWHYCLPGRWVNLGVTQAAGESLNWFKHAFDGGREDAASGDIFAEYNREIGGIPDGSDGLVYLPYLNGERTPHWDADARGVFFGIGINHTKAHFIKAIMEGVSFALRDCVESVEDLDVAVSAVRAVGGGLKSPVWRTSLARILSRPVRTVEHPDTGNLGNAMLAAVGTGRYRSPEEASQAMVAPGKDLDEEAVPELERRYRTFKELYPVLKRTFKSNVEDERE
jgi:xylulokinase